jgi:hypothetical protein
MPKTTLLKKCHSRFHTEELIVIIWSRSGIYFMPEVFEIREKVAPRIDLPIRPLLYSHLQPSTADSATTGIGEKEIQLITKLLECLISKNFEAGSKEFSCIVSLNMFQNANTSIKLHTFRNTVLT